MVAIFILGFSLLSAFACAVGLKYFLCYYNTNRIEYYPMNNNLVQEEESNNDVPPKYDEINLVN
jgi:hypothetical protein